LRKNAAMQHFNIPHYETIFPNICHQGIPKAKAKSGIIRKEDPHQQ
jgi:hypothetical protein